MKNAIIPILLLLAACTAPQNEPLTSPDTASEPSGSLGSADNPGTAPLPSDSLGSTDNPDRIFQLTGTSFKFWMGGVENPELKVNMGEIVRIEFESTDGFHDWKIDEFNAATEKVNPGTPTAVTFVADKKGTFEYYCSVGTHRQMGMKGSLIVE